MKAHLLDSDIPILEGSTVTANCGKMVPNVKAVFMFDYEFGQSATFNVFLVCSACQEIEGSKRGHYIYGILNGQELKHSEI